MPFPVDIQYVNQAERQLGVKFPPAYVTRMVKCNGGDVEVLPKHGLSPVDDLR